MKRRTISNVVKAYIGFGIAWIVLSDWLLANIMPPFLMMRYAGTFKGIGMVIVSGLLINRLIRKEEEVRLAKEAQHMITTIINYMPDVVCFKNMSGQWRQTSDETLRLFELSNTDYQNKTDQELGIDASFFDTPIAESWEQQETHRREKTMITSQGKKRIYEVIQLYLYSHTQEKIGVLTMGRDITWIKQKEQQVLTSEKTLVVGKLAAGVAHEIRNPLTSIKGFTQLLQHSPSVQPDYLAIISTELEKIETIVDDFLSFATPTETEFIRQPLEPLLEQTLHELTDVTNLQNVELKTVIDVKNPCLLGDSKQLLQIFRNISKNAVEAMPTGGTFTIRVSNKNEEIHIDFCDTGIGMPPERIKTLGEPSYVSTEKGTGMGLMVAYKLIYAHKGRVSVTSTVGKGTVFTLSFPSA